MSAVFKITDVTIHLEFSFPLSFMATRQVLLVVLCT